jgi:hypothetical protein
MKKLISSIVIFGFFCAKIVAQNSNPYEQFGYQPKNQYVMTKNYDGLLLVNKDSSATSKKMLINFKEKQISVINDSDKTINTFAFSEDDFARFLSSDLLTKQYPMLSPYQYAANRPIDGIDLDGLEFLPFQKSMYRMQYGTITSDQILGSGETQTVTTSYTVVKSVYSNIPAALQDSKAQDFKYVSGGPVTAWGRDWDTDKDGAIVYATGRYYNNGPQFYGAAEGGKSTNGINSLKGNATPGTTVTAQNINGVGGAVGPNGFGGMYSNWSNQSIWKGLTKESKYRQGFYNATNVIDNYMNNNAIGGNQLSGAEDRTMLVNFLTDGYLPTGVTDGFTGAEYSNIRRDAYGKQLLVAYHGLQIMQHLKSQGIDIEIQKDTKTAIQDLLTKYKADGGGNNYDNITNFIE